MLKIVMIIICNYMKVNREGDCKSKTVVLDFEFVDDGVYNEHDFYAVKSKQMLAVSEFACPCLRL